MPRPGLTATTAATVEGVVEGEGVEVQPEKERMIAVNRIERCNRLQREKINIQDRFREREMMWFLSLRELVLI
jgi:hypothetical protein